MKRFDWIFLISLVAYSLLFWEQEPGLNVLIMNIVLLAGIVLNDKTVLKNRHWVVCALAAVITASCEAYYGNALSFFGNFISLLGVAGYSVHRGNSWIATCIMAFASGVSAVGFIIVAAINRMSSVKEEKPHRFSWKRVLLLLIVLVVGLLFFSLYRGSSILFQSLTDKIDLSFISIGWCAFMVFGTIALFGFYKQQKFSRIAEWERSQPLNLQPGARKGLLDKMMSLDSEYFSGIVLLGMLNLMLLTVNGLDMTFLLNGASFLPDDVTYSQYVHQGIDMLILSIVCATLVILYYFRNYHEFTKQYSALKWLALLWVIQNIFMVGTTIYRNHSYVYVFGMTYQRIGVDVFLLLAMVGLLLLTWKVLKQKSLAFAIRGFGWAFLAIFVMACPVNWDKTIFHYNSSLHRRLDMNYLNEISSAILVEQHAYNKKGYELTHDEKYDLDRKTFSFLTRVRGWHENNRWQSFTFIDNRVYNELMGMNTLQEDSTLYAGYSQLDTIYYFPGYANSREVILAGNNITSMGEISRYTRMEVLDVQYNYELKSIAGIEKCGNLRELNLENTGVTDFSPLELMPGLRLLKVTYMDLQQREALRISNPNLVINNEWKPGEEIR